MAQYENGLIVFLDDNECFVFGSNIRGEHVGGAAKQAYEDFDAEWGIGEGLTGDCYAFPTLDHRMCQMSLGELAPIRDAFYRCVRAHPERTFLLTKVGCGIAGYDELAIRKVFEDAYKYKNIVLPGDWRR